MAERGADLAFGRTLPRLLREAGLEDVRADGVLSDHLARVHDLEAATVRQVRERLVAAGLATRREIDQHLANLATGQPRPRDRTVDLRLGPQAAVTCECPIRPDLDTCRKMRHNCGHGNRATPHCPGSPERIGGPGRTPS